jgi:replicative DNA helicase
MQTDKGCQTLWIDNLKIVDGLNNQNELERFQYVSRQIRLLARETNAHVVAIHHVTKIPVGRFITVNDAYGSSAFRQDADTVILMNKDIETGYIALEAGKARNGVEGLRRDVIFTGATQRFIEKSTERRF